MLLIPLSPLKSLLLRACARGGSTRGLRIERWTVWCGRWSLWIESLFLLWSTIEHTWQRYSKLPHIARRSGLKCTEASKLILFGPDLWREKCLPDALIYDLLLFSIRKWIAKRDFKSLVQTDILWGDLSVTTTFLVEGLEGLTNDLEHLTDLWHVIFRCTTVLEMIILIVMIEYVLHQMLVPGQNRLCPFNTTFTLGVLK